MISLPLLADILPAPTEFLTVGKSMGDEITLTVGPLYTMGFLIAGPVLILLGIILVWVMYSRVKYFAMEFGYGTGWGRIKAISFSIAFGAILAALGIVSCLIGWANQGYSVVLSAAGLTEIHPLGTHAYKWDDLKATSGRINSTDFWLSFERDGRRCQVAFHQQELGVSVQDKAIQIAEAAIMRLPPLQ